MELNNPLDKLGADANLEKILNLNEKGADVIILHLGSQSLKFGLASQMQPFIMPNVIAHRTVKPKPKASIALATSAALSLAFPSGESAPGTKVQAMLTSDSGTGSQMQLQITDYVSQTLEQQLAYVESVLCRQKYILIDQKKPKWSKKSPVPHSLSSPLTVNHKALSYQIYTSDNSLSYIPENAPAPLEKWTADPGQLISTSLNDYLVNNSFAFVDTSAHPEYLVGHAALNIHRSDSYVVQWPLRYGYFNVSASQGAGTVLDNIEKILLFAVTERLRIPRAKFGLYSVILIIPDLYSKTEVKCYLDILLKRLQFRSAYLQQESVLASFAYALQSACVVDIGAQKTSVCCVDEGAILPGTMVRRNFGGDDITHLLYRLLTRPTTLHYFPGQVLNILDPYHFRLVERLKEDDCHCVRNAPEAVKTCKLWVHDKAKKTTVATFNVSDALVIAPFGIFYAELMATVNPKYLAAESCFGYTGMRERDPEDVMQLLIAETLAESAKKLDEDKREAKKPEDAKESSREELKQPKFDLGKGESSDQSLLPSLNQNLAQQQSLTQIEVQIEMPIPMPKEEDSLRKKGDRNGENGSDSKGSLKDEGRRGDFEDGKGGSGKGDKEGSKVERMDIKGEKDKEEDKAESRVGKSGKKDKGDKAENKRDREDSKKDRDESKAEKAERETLLADANKGMNLVEMICKSLMKVEDPELRQKLGNSILLVGGGTKFRDFMEVLEERLIEKLGEFSNNIERVEVVNHAATQKDRILLCVPLCHFGSVHIC